MTTQPVAPAPRHRLHLTPTQALACVLPGPLALDPLRDAARSLEAQRLREAWLKATEALEAFYEQAAADGLLAAQPETVTVDLAEAMDAVDDAAVGAPDDAGLPSAGLVAVPALHGPGDAVDGAPEGAEAAIRQPLGSGNIVQVPIGDLVANGFLKVGQRIVPAEAEWQSPGAQATVAPNGLRFPDGTLHKKLSPAASAVTGKSTSGWTFWIVAATGERLDAVRDRYLAEFPEWVAAARAELAAKRAEKQTVEK